MYEKFHQLLSVKFVFVFFEKLIIKVQSYIIKNYWILFLDEMIVVSNLITASISTANLVIEKG